MRLQQNRRIRKYLIYYLDNPNAKRQRIFDELGMIEMITRMLEQINNADFPREDANSYGGAREILRGLE